MAFMGVYAEAEGDAEFNPLQNIYYFNDQDLDKCFKGAESNASGCGFITFPARRHCGEKFPLTIHASGALPWFEKHTQEEYGKRTQAYKELKFKILNEIFSGMNSAGLGRIVEKIKKVDHSRYFDSASPRKNIREITDTLEGLFLWYQQTNSILL